MASTLITLASESAGHEGGVNPWLVGVGTLALLLVLLIAVVSFGGGRDHT